MPKFYIIIARRIFFPIVFFLGGGHVLPVPSPTPLSECPEHTKCGGKNAKRIGVVSAS